LRTKARRKETAPLRGVVDWGDEYVKLRQLGGQIQPQRVKTMVLIPARAEAAHTVHRAPMEPDGV
jgi:hypothetical protein